MKFSVKECYVCRTRRPGKKTVKEGGVTDISLHNAHVLIDYHGKPVHLSLRYDKEEWQAVEATWDDGTKFRFTGFAWGYGGTGPNGLSNFFDMIGIKIAIAEIASWVPVPEEPKDEKDLLIKEFVRHGDEWKEVEQPTSA